MMLDSTLSAEREYQARLARAERFNHTAEAVRNVAERLYGQRKPRSDRDASVAVTVDHMLNEPAVYGFDGDGVDADDLANAITASCRDWEYYHFKHPDKLPDDPAHAFILKATRKAVTAILAGAYGQWCIEEELDYLKEDA